MIRLKRNFAWLAAVTISLSAASCDSTSPYDLGKLSVKVVNQDGAGVPGVLVDLYKVQEGAAIYWRAGITDANGLAVLGAKDGGVVVGDYFVRLTILSQYRLAADEANDRPVTIAEGDDTVMTFNVVQSSPGVGL